MARLAVAHERHIEKYSVSVYWRVLAGNSFHVQHFVYIMFRVLLLLATFMQVYFNLLNLQQMIIIKALLGLRRRRLIAIELHRRILRRRRRRPRRRFWRLPRRMNSWFEIHYNDPLIPEVYFKEQLRVRKETFEVILNRLNPHLTRQDTAMHDFKESSG